MRKPLQRSSALSAGYRDHPQTALDNHVSRPGGHRPDTFGLDNTGSPQAYGRRHGIDLRNARHETVLYQPENEAAFRDFLRNGMMAPFLRELEEEKRTELLPSRPWHFLDDDEEEPRLAKFEAALWQECEENFECETKAYAQLKDLQGKAIPRMLAHVVLGPGEADIVVPPDLQHMASYFEVKGVLLERIDGYELREVATSPQAPSDPTQWQAIIQAAADAAHEVNKRGVLMSDASPRNVVVDRHSDVPYIVDFAQCWFKDELMQMWLDDGWDEDEEWDAEVE